MDTNLSANIVYNIRDNLWRFVGKTKSLVGEDKAYTSWGPTNTTTHNSSSPPTTTRGMP